MPTRPQIGLQPSSHSPGSETSQTRHNPGKKRDMKKKSRPGASDDDEDPPTSSDEDEDPSTSSDEDKDRPPSISEALDMPKFLALEIVASDDESVQEVLKEGDL